MAEQGSGGQTAVASGAPTRGAARSLPDALMAELRAAYREEVGERLAALVAALVEPQQPQAARHAAHALRSSAWVVGAYDVSALAKDVEARIVARQPWADETAALVELLRAGGTA